jgi:hypothetical protein
VPFSDRSADGMKSPPQTWRQAPSRRGFVVRKRDKCRMIRDFDRVAPHVCELFHILYHFLWLSLPPASGMVACIFIDVASDLLERCARASLLERAGTTVLRL